MHMTGHELGEAVFGDFTEPAGRFQPLQESQGAAAEPAAQLEDRAAWPGKPLLDGERSQAVVDDIEAVVVGEVVDPEPETPGREEDFFTGDLASKKCRVVPRDGLREGIRGNPGRC